MVAFAAVALAGDIVSVDGDRVGADVNPVDLGTVAAGASVSKFAKFTITCSTQQHLDSGDLVTFTYTAADSTIPSGGTLSATTGEIPRPSTWPGDGSPCAATPQTVSSANNKDSNVSITAPTTPGDYSFVVSYTIGGTGVGGNDLQGNSKITVTYNLTVDSAPSISSTTPANGATGVATNANITLNFSEPVNVSGAWFSISCANSGSHAASASGDGTSSLTLNPGSDFGSSELCSVAIDKTRVSDVDSADPPDNMAANYNFSFTTAAPAVVDTDGDGVPDATDNCPANANANQANNDGDAQGDVCDTDDDNDTILDGADNCPITANTNQANNDGDAQGDVCDTDDDNDTILDGADNCPITANTNQANNDGDAQGDVCDTDDDNDTILDGADNCQFAANTNQADGDGDGIGNACDPNAFAPEVGSAAVDASGFEGGTLNTSGSFTDADPTGTLTISKVSGVGDFTDNGDGTWSWSYTAANDGSGTVVVEASDGEHTAASDTFDWSAANAAPTKPGKPSLSSGSSPNSSGQYTMSWAASSDVSGDTVTYSLYHKDANDGTYSLVQSGLSATSYVFGSGNAESEGTWTYHVIASDGEALNSTSDTSDASDGVVVDKHGPTVSGTITSTPHTVGPVTWYKDTAAISWSATDPNLVDGSAGSGVAGSATGDSPIGEGWDQTANGSASDNAGNTGNGTVQHINVDAGAPDVSASITSSPAYNDGTDDWYKDSVTVGVTASDPDLAGGHSGSGLATNPSGPHTFTASGSYTATAVDNVGHSTDSDTVNFLVDAAAPTGGAVSVTAGYNNTGAVAVSVTDATDTGSGIASNQVKRMLGTLAAGNCDFSSGTWANVTLSGGNDTVASGKCVKYQLVATDNVGHEATFGPSGVVKVDTSAPTITFNHTSPAPNANLALNGFGWNKTSPVTAYWDCADAQSGVVNTSVNNQAAGEGYNQKVTGTCTNNADLTADADRYINIDLTAPGVTWSGGINNGDSFYFGSVPAAPTCNATDALSGPNGCVVTGYSTAVGPHTLTATAHDKADNDGVETRSYTVLAWTLKGFFAPVDMSGATTIWNTVKNGSTVPLKFQVFSGTTELTSTSVVNQPLTAVGVTCGVGTADDIELLSTGGTSLRYDGTAHQFIYNWQTPKKAGACYKVSVTTQDGSALAAYFQLK
jgi:hypothetical protein